MASAGQVVDRIPGGHRSGVVVEGRHRSELFCSTKVYHTS